MTKDAIRARGVRIVRRGSEVLRGLDFTVGAGGVTGLLGPSGCGKTTLMRAVVGTQRITHGTVDVLGEPAGTPSLRRRVGYASQDAAVYDDLTVAENVRYFAVALRAGRAEADRVIEQVRLGRHRDHLVARLSGGERSRVSLAVAMLGRPALLVLDEPTVGLDPVLREELWLLFGELAADGATLLVSSHVMDEAQRCTDLLLMREGRLLTHDTPAGLTRRTGTTDLDAAFLRLIEGPGGGAGDVR